MSTLKSEFHLVWCFGSKVDTHKNIHAYPHMYEPGRGVARCGQDQPNKPLFIMYSKEGKIGVGKKERRKEKKAKKKKKEGKRRCGWKKRRGKKKSKMKKK